SLTDDQLIAVCDLIEADQKHLHAVSTSTAAVLDPTSTTDIASRMLAKSYKYSFGQFSSMPFAGASLLGRLLTTDFDANNTTITLMYKQEPGIV
ncbi:DUF3383 family protein, partial [Lactococcus lactis]|uniref:DUF3383 family protein n=2 Tax=Bacteria TaxID=2 RepID=UPI003D0C79A7